MDGPPQRDDSTSGVRSKRTLDQIRIRESVKFSR